MGDFFFSTVCYLSSKSWSDYAGCHFRLPHLWVRGCLTFISIVQFFYGSNVDARIYTRSLVSSLFLLKSMQSEVHCVQRHDSAVVQEVNCTEAVSMATWSGSAGVMKTRTVSFLVLLRAQPGNSPAEGEESNQLILDNPFTPIIPYTADIKKPCLSFPMLLQMLKALTYQQVCSLRIRQLQDQERPGHQPLNKQVKLSGSCAASSLIPDW